MAASAVVPRSRCARRADAPVSDLLLSQFVEATDASDAPFVSLTVTGAYPALIWWTFILVGLAVGRCDLGAARVRTRLAMAGAGLAVLGYGGGWLTTEWWADGRPSLGPLDGVAESGDWGLASLSGAAPHSGTTLEIAGSTGVALVVIAVCLVVADRLPSAHLPARRGRGDGVDGVRRQRRRDLGDSAAPTTDSNLPWGVYVLVTLALAIAWRFAFGRGPLERLLTWSSVRAASERPGTPPAAQRIGLPPVTATRAPEM